MKPVTGRCHDPDRAGSLDTPRPGMQELIPLRSFGTHEPRMDGDPLLKNYDHGHTRWIYMESRTVQKEKEGGWEQNNPRAVINTRRPTLIIFL